MVRKSRNYNNEQHHPTCGALSYSASLMQMAHMFAMQPFQCKIESHHLKGSIEHLQHFALH